MLHLFWNTEKSGKRFTWRKKYLRSFNSGLVLWCLKGVCVGNPDNLLPILDLSLFSGGGGRGRETGTDSGEQVYSIKAAQFSCSIWIAASPCFISCFGPADRGIKLNSPSLRSAEHPQLPLSSAEVPGTSSLESSTANDMCRAPARTAARGLHLTHCLFIRENGKQPLGQHNCLAASSCTCTRPSRDLLVSLPPPAGMGQGVCLQTQLPLCSYSQPPRPPRAQDSPKQLARLHGCNASLRCGDTQVIYSSPVLCWFSEWHITN